MFARGVGAEDKGEGKDAFCLATVDDAFFFNDVLGDVVGLLILFCDRRRTFSFLLEAADFLAGKASNFVGFDCCCALTVFTFSAFFSAQRAFLSASACSAAATAATCSGEGPLGGLEFSGGAAVVGLVGTRAVVILSFACVLCYCLLPAQFF